MVINKENCKKKILHDVFIALRTTREVKTWIKKNNLIPKLIFNEALKELGFEGEL